jgi:hypothetical protein
MYSDGMMLGIGVLVRFIAVILAYPILLFVIIYRKLTKKKRLNLLDWILD